MIRAIAVVSLLALSGCKGGEPVDRDAAGLERRIETFERPDRHGVVCYQDISSYELSCVKVSP